MHAWEMLGGDGMDGHKPNKNADMGRGCAYIGDGGLVIELTAL